MASLAQLSLLNKLLNLSEITVKDYQLNEEVGIIIHVEKKVNRAKCPRCNQYSNRLHQNHWNLIRDLPWNNRLVYLRLNRRQFKCSCCRKPFSEEFNFITKKRTYTIRLARQIINETSERRFAAIAQRYGLTETEVKRIIQKPQ